MVRIQGEVKRIKPTFKEMVKIPLRFRIFFWDCPEGKVILEKFILRILNYGKFEDLKWVYKRYPKETYEVAFKYGNIRRGVKFLLKFWRDNEI